MFMFLVYKHTWWVYTPRQASCMLAYMLTDIPFQLYACIWGLDILDYVVYKSTLRGFAPVSKDQARSYTWFIVHTECTYPRHKELVLLIAMANRHVLAGVHMFANIVLLCKCMEGTCTGGFHTQCS